MKQPAATGAPVDRSSLAPTSSRRGGGAGSPGPADSPAVLAAFARGDFAAVRRLAPGFVAPGPDGGLAPVGLFSPSRSLRLIAAGSAVVLAAAWWYALQPR